MSVLGPTMKFEVRDIVGSKAGNESKVDWFSWF